MSFPRRFSGCCPGVPGCNPACQGPRGPTGPTGPTGMNGGPQGPQGPTGLTGPTGPASGPSVGATGPTNFQTYGSAISYSTAGATAVETEFTNYVVIPFVAGATGPGFVLSNGGTNFSVATSGVYAVTISATVLSTAESSFEVALYNTVSAIGIPVAIGKASGTFGATFTRTFITMLDSTLTYYVTLSQEPYFTGGPVVRLYVDDSNPARSASLTLVLLQY